LLETPVFEVRSQTIRRAGCAWLYQAFQGIHKTGSLNAALKAIAVGSADSGASTYTINFDPSASFELRDNRTPSLNKRSAAASSQIL
jgi:hypothetical protein